MGRIRRFLRRARRRVRRAVRRTVEGVIDLATTVINAIIEVLESTLGWVLSFVTIPIDFVLSIPVLGRLIKWLLNIALSIVWAIVGLIDFLLSLIGILPEKKLRVCAVILRDENGMDLDTKRRVKDHLQDAIDIFWDQANVRIIRSAPFQFDSGFAGAENAGEEWIHFFKPTLTTVLDVNCRTRAAREDLWLTGTSFEFIASLVCPYGNFRRLIGYGAPICVFVVRTISGPYDGCSLGPLADYVTVQVTRSPLTIAHELGHACNLWHVDSSNNLMNNGSTGRNLKRWQVAILRNSRHVTYF